MVLSDTRLITFGRKKKHNKTNTKVKHDVTKVLTKKQFSDDNQL